MQDFPSIEKIWFRLIAMGTRYDVMHSRLSHFGGKCYQTTNKLRDQMWALFFILSFVSLLSTKYRVSHQQSPDIVREKSTSKVYLFFNRCACKIHVSRTF